MSGKKSIDRIPDFRVEDIHRKFACWLQARCREDPFFFRKIVDVTWSSEETVKRWRKGQAPGAEAMLRALGFAGPLAVDEVLLEPMGMAGARWIEDDRVSGPIHGARRAVRAARDQLSSDETPDRQDVEFAIVAAIALVGEATALLKDLNDLRQETEASAATTGADVLDLPANRKYRA